MPALCSAMWRLQISLVLSCMVCEICETVQARCLDATTTVTLKQCCTACLIQPACSMNVFKRLTFVFWCHLQWMMLKDYASLFCKHSSRNHWTSNDMHDVNEKITLTRFKYNDSNSDEKNSENCEMNATRWQECLQTSVALPSFRLNDLLKIDNDVGNAAEIG